MSRVVSMRLREDQMERLRRQARRLGRTPSETAALFVEEALRMAEFGHIHFRSSVAGRDAYVTGTGLAVWEVVMVAEGLERDAARTADVLELPMVKVQAALNYAEAFPEEIQEALEDNRKGFAALKRMLPGIEEFVAPDRGERIDADNAERTNTPV